MHYPIRSRAPLRSLVRSLAHSLAPELVGRWNIFVQFPRCPESLWTIVYSKSNSRTGDEGSEFLEAVLILDSSFEEVSEDFLVGRVI